MKRRGSRKRSRLARRAWDTRTRRQGMRQIGKSVIGKSSPFISTAKFAKDLSLGAYKILDPRGYRRNVKAKKIDKYL